MLATGGWACKNCDCSYLVFDANMTAKGFNLDGTDRVEIKEQGFLQVLTKKGTFINAFLWSGKSRILDPRIYQAPNNKNKSYSQSLQNVRYKRHLLVRYFTIIHRSPCT